MSNCLIGWPIWSDEGVSYTPTFDDSGAWPAALPIENLQDRRLHRVARSASAELADTRLRQDLGVDRPVAGVFFPAMNLSTAAKWRVLGVPSTMLFDYEAGDDIAARSGTFTRAPTAGARAATYVDAAGRIQFAGENRCLRSEEFDNASWTKSNVTVAANAVADPFGDLLADTLTANAGNGTCRQGVATTAVSWTYSVWLKRKTGSGNIDISMDGTTWVTKSVTTDWQRFDVTQTGVAGTSNPGIRIVTSGDAVYAWGAQVQIGTARTSYLPTTTAAVGAPRDSHFVAIGGVRTHLLEPARTNLVLQSSNFGTTWAAVGTPTRTGSAATCGVVALDLIGDDSGAAAEGYQQTITFTGNAAKAISFFVRQGTSTSTMVRLLDTTAADTKMLFVITWSGGLPVITASTGTSLGYTTHVDANGNAVFRVLAVTGAVTAANTNVLSFFPATNGAAAGAPTGDVYIGGVQAEDGLFPTSHIPTTTATVARAADELNYSASGVTPQALTVDFQFYELGTYLVGGGTQIFQLGGSDPTLTLDAPTAGTGNYRALHVTAGGVSSSATPSAVYGDLVEARLALASTGTITLGASKNGGTESVGATSATETLGVAWNPALIKLKIANGAAFALTRCRIVAGVQTLATMQTVVHDSGWLTAWPSGIDAEESEGMNIPLVHIPSSAFTARYWSVQISDAANADGYVDLGQLLITGGYTPTINFAYGAELGVDTQSTRQRTRSGVAYHDEQPRFRRFDFTLDNVDEDEFMVNIFDFQRRAGIHGQFFFVLNPADTTHMHRRAFRAVLERLIPAQLTYLTKHRQVFSIVEDP